MPATEAITTTIPEATAGYSFVKAYQANAVNKRTEANAKKTPRYDVRTILSTNFSSFLCLAAASFSAIFNIRSAAPGRVLSYFSNASGGGIVPEN